MNSVMTLSKLATRPGTTFRVRVDDQSRNFWLERENACLTQNNAQLRLQLKDLEASSQAWIRLYESALERANTATAEVAWLRKELENCSQSNPDRTR